jgi:hypothetical protein
MLATWVLNLYDAIVTIYATERLGLIEANPLMRVCLATSVVLFIAVKMLVLDLVLRVLKRRYETRPSTTKLLTIGMFLAFLLVGIWNTSIVIILLTIE